MSNPLVYNFVLSTGHILVVDGVACCTLGHGLKGDVIEHAFYGTQAVVNDLKAFPGWTSGVVVLTPSNVVSHQGVITSYTMI